MSSSSSSPIITQNSLKRKLKAGECATGCMLAEIRQPSIMQMLHNGGMEFVIIDNEHGPFNIETIADLARTAKYIGITPIVRVPDSTYVCISQSLDSGAQGLMFPRIISAQQVKEIVSITRYPPHGQRGNAQGRGYTNFKSGNVVQTMKATDEENFIIIQIETKESIENLDAILTVPGVDAALVGPNDLSISLGVPGELSSKVLNDAIEKVITHCNKHGVVPALHCNDLEFAKSWATKGMRLISYDSEIGYVQKSASQATSQIKQAFPKK